VEVAQKMCKVPPLCVQVYRFYAKVNSIMRLIIIIFYAEMDTIYIHYMNKNNSI